jgi:hypothetical protein
MHNDIANTEVQAKQVSDQRFWRYNDFEKEKGVLSKLHDHIFIVHKQLGTISTLLLQRHI